MLCVYVYQHVWRAKLTDNLWELVLPPNHEGSRDQTQEIRLSGRYRYLLSHPTCPK